MNNLSGDNAMTDFKYDYDEAAVRFAKKRELVISMKGGKSELPQNEVKTAAKPSKTAASNKENSLSL